MGKGRSFKDLKRTYQIAILGNRTYFPDGAFFHEAVFFEYLTDPAMQVKINEIVGREETHKAELRLSAE